MIMFEVLILPFDKGFSLRFFFYCTLHNKLYLLYFNDNDFCKLFRFLLINQNAMNQHILFCSTIQNEFNSLSQIYKYIFLSFYLISSRCFFYLFIYTATVLVHEWGHYRWGLFDEYPTSKDIFTKKIIQFYSHSGRWEPVR